MMKFLLIVCFHDTMNQRNIFFFLRSVSNTHTVIQDTQGAEISQKQDRQA